MEDRLTQANGFEGFGVPVNDIDALPPEQRERARRALDEYLAREPIAEITVRVFKLAPGGSEVQFKTQVPEGVSRPEWYEHVARVAADEVRDAGTSFGSP
jgi:hypothetical protein